MLPDKVVWIEGDRFWTFLRKGYGRGPTSGSFRLLMASMLAAAVPFAAAGATTVVDFSIPPWYLDTAKKIAALRELPLDYIVLKPSLEICASRARNRNEGAIRDYGSLAELYHEFERIPTTHIVDELLEPTETAALLAAGLNAGRFRVG